MKNYLIFLILLLFISEKSIAQKMLGFGGEISVLSIKPNVRIWTSKTFGMEAFVGQASELETINPNDLEAGVKFLKAIQYNRTDRVYIGLMGKYKWLNVYEPNRTTSLPVPGVLIGKEWYSKRMFKKGFAVELGYQFGVKEYSVFSPDNTIKIGTRRFEEFPLILNIRYSFYQKR